MLKNWFEEASKVCKVFTSEEEVFLIYKGFRISYNEDRYLLQDTRKSNMYSKVNPRDLKLLTSKNFIEGCDIISFRRSINRVKSIERQLVKLYARRKKAKSLLNTNRKMNEKRIRNINKRISYLIDEMFLNKARINQFNIKYNRNE